MRKIALIGSGPLCERLIYYFSSTGFGEAVGMFDDYEPIDKMIYGLPILGDIDSAPRLFQKRIFDEVAIAVGYRHLRFRQRVYEFLEGNRVPLTSFVHPSSHVEPSAVLGRGCIVLVRCVIDMKARLEDNVFMSSRGFLSHHVFVDAHTFIGPGVNLAGGTTVGQRCFLGINTTTIDGIRIASDAHTAAGSVVTRDVPSYSLVAGVPAVVKKHLADSR